MPAARQVPRRRIGSFHAPHPPTPAADSLRQRSSMADPSTAGTRAARSHREAPPPPRRPPPAVRRSPTTPRQGDHIQARSPAPAAFARVCPSAPNPPGTTPWKGSQGSQRGPRGASRRALDPFASRNDLPTFRARACDGASSGGAAPSALHPPLSLHTPRATDGGQASRATLTRRQSRAAARVMAACAAAAHATHRDLQIVRRRAGDSRARPSPPSDVYASVGRQRYWPPSRAAVPPAARAPRPALWRAGPSPGAQAAAQRGTRRDPGRDRHARQPGTRRRAHASPYRQNRRRQESQRPQSTPWDSAAIDPGNTLPVPARPAGGPQCRSCRRDPTRRTHYTTYQDYLAPFRSTFLLAPRQMCLPVLRQTLALGPRRSPPAGPAHPASSAGPPVLVRVP